MFPVLIEFCAADVMFRCMVNSSFVLFSNSKTLFFHGWQIIKLSPPRPPGTAHGVFGSVAGVTGAWSDTVSRLTFDDEYRTKREMDKHKARSKQGGIKQGLKQVFFRFSLSILQHVLPFLLSLVRLRSDHG